MLRDQVAAWATVAFAVLLLLLTVSDQGGSAFVGSLLLLAWALGLMYVFFAVEQRLRERARQRARQGAGGA